MTTMQTTIASPVHAQSSVAAAEIARMRASLEKWLKYRMNNDAAAKGTPIASPLLRTPGAVAPPPSVTAARLRMERPASEAKLAANLHALLSEVFDSSTLPSPDINANPNAAVDLATIAISGKLPNESPSPSDVGFIWMWPLVIVVGAIAFVITSKIRNDAEEAAERERLQCIREGRCTDSGFWLKGASVLVIGWFLWDKVGLREKVSGSSSRRRRR